MTTQEKQYWLFEQQRRQDLLRAYVAGIEQQQSIKLDFLCFTAQDAGSTIKLQNVVGSYQTSHTGLVGSWTDYTLGTDITLNKDQKVYFKAKTTNDTCWNNIYNPKFIMTGKITASGNIQSLLDETCKRSDVPTNCYCRMFQGCSSLTQAPELPATTLANNCYDSMFYGCSSLTQAPALPATTLTDYCYGNMFNGCSSLTQAPALPAMALANRCYTDMFINCPKFSEVHMKEHMATIYIPARYNIFGNIGKTPIFDIPN